MDGLNPAPTEGDRCTLFRSSDRAYGRHRIIDQTNSDLEFLRYGRIVPGNGPVRFDTGEEEMALFCVGGAGTIVAGGTAHELGKYDALYVPIGTAVEVTSAGFFDVAEIVRREAAGQRRRLAHSVEHAHRLVVDRHHPRPARAQVIEDGRLLLTAHVAIGGVEALVPGLRARQLSADRPPEPQRARRVEQAPLHPLALLGRVPRLEAVQRRGRQMGREGGDLNEGAAHLLLLRHRVDEMARRPGAGRPVVAALLHAPEREPGARADRAPVAVEHPDRDLALEASEAPVVVGEDAVGEAVRGVREHGERLVVVLDDLHTEVGPEELLVGVALDVVHPRREPMQRRVDERAAVPRPTFEDHLGPPRAPALDAGEEAGSRLERGERPSEARAILRVAEAKRGGWPP